MIILLNGNPVEELSTIVHASSAVEKAKALCFKLLNLIPKQQFLISIQAKVGAKILARENLPALRKDVCAKLVSVHKFQIYVLQLYTICFFSN